MGPFVNYVITLWSLVGPQKVNVYQILIPFITHTLVAGENFVPQNSRKWDCISDSTNAEIHHLYKHKLKFP